MGQYKYLIAQFTFYDRTGICRLLEEQAQKGWVLDKVTNFAWRLRRIEPQKIHYAVTYFPKASAYDPHPSEQQQELFEYCAHSGWVLAGTTAQMQVFYNMSEDPVPIETDPMMELENTHASAKKNYLPAYFMLLGLSVIQIGLQISQLIISPLSYLSQDTALFNWLCQSVLLLMCGMEIFGYFSWYRKAKRAAENGEFVETKGYRKFQLFLLAVVIIALVWLLCTMRPRLATIMGIILVMLFAVIFGVTGIQTVMKHKGVPTKTNRTVTWVLALILSVVVTGMIFPVTGAVMDLPVWEENRKVRQFEWNGHYFDIYNDPIPLRVEDLTDAVCPDYSYRAWKQGSPLLQKGEYDQMVWASSEYPEMSYIIYSTKIPVIYDLVVRELRKPMEYPAGVYENGEPYYDVYVWQEAAPWGANEVWRRFAGGEPYDNWILCYDDTVVYFTPDWELTAEQMAKVGKILC